MFFSGGSSAPNSAAIHSSKNSINFFGSRSVDARMLTFDCIELQMFGDGVEKIFSRLHFQALQLDYAIE